MDYTVLTLKQVWLCNINRPRIIECLFAFPHEQVDGNIFVVYNMGTEDHPIGEVLSKVNDGLYHVVRFIRSGPNATVQIDDYEVREKNPKGEFKHDKDSEEYCW